MKEKILTLLTLSNYRDYEAIKALLEQDYKEENDILILKHNPYDTNGVYWGKNIVYKQEKARDIVLRGEYTHLFSLEADVIIPKDCLSRLISDDKDVICGLYRLHSHSGQLEGKWPIFKRNCQGGYDNILDGVVFNTGKIIEVDLLPFGCTLIKRKVLEQVDFDLGLDGSFGMKCKNVGFSLWADTDIMCRHIDHYKKK